MRFNEKRWQRAALAGLAVAVLVAAPLAMAERRKEKIDLSAIPAGQGVVFGSVLLDWEQKGAVKSLLASRWLVVVQDEDRAESKRGWGGGVATIDAKAAKEEHFILQLPAGEYEAWALFAKDPFLGGPTDPGWVIGAHFDVLEGQVTYVGRFVIKMPTRPQASLLGIPFVRPSGFWVEDGLDSATGWLAATQGGLPGSVESRLMRAPGDWDTGEFESIERGGRLEVGAAHWGMTLPPANAIAASGTYAEGGVHVTRLVFEPGESPEAWSRALEILLVDRDVAPANPKKFLEMNRKQDDKTCPGSEWTVLGKDDASLTYEFRNGTCKPPDTEHSLNRIVYGNRHVLVFMYTRNSRIPDGERTAWLEALATAKAKD